MAHAKNEANADYISIRAVEPGSIAEELGLAPGDQILSLNGELPADVVGWEYAQAEEELELHVRKTDGEEYLFEIDKEPDEGLGLDIDVGSLSPLRRCQNHCLFCFLDQMPSGLRSSLYVKDDDYRSSFISGNFITLTNLSQSDWHRILQLRLSPLYISVHTVDPALRRLLLGHPRAGDIRGQLHALAAGGIDLHLQAVMIPDINDGTRLDETITLAGELYPRAQSLAIVPVGLTRHRRGQDGLRLYTPAEARKLIQRVETWQNHYVQTLGHPLVYLSDEWYLRAGKDVPGTGHYGDYPQLENGVGLVRQFWDDLKHIPWEQLPRVDRPVLLVTGELAAPLVEELAGLLRFRSRTDVRVVPVNNRFFGRQVTVAGLVTGQDFEEALKHCGYGGELVLFPSVMLDANREQFLDGVEVEELRRRLPGYQVEPVDTLANMPQILRQMLKKGAG